MIRKVLLHVQKFMPDFLIKLCMSDERYANKPYVLSQHMEEHLVNPNFKHNIEYRELLDCVNSLKQSPVKPFELEVVIDDNPTGKNNNKTYAITKWVVRMPYDEDQDISIAVRGNVIVTAWLNNKDDTHYTLDLSQYVSNL